MSKFRPDRRFRRDPYVLTSSVILNMMTFALPLMMLQIYDRIIPRQGYESLTVLAIGVVVAISLELLMRVARTHIMSLAGEAFAKKTYKQIYTIMLKTDFTKIESQATGAHMDRISSIERVREFRFGETAMAALDLPFALIFLVVVALIAPPLALLLVGMLVCSMIVMRILQSKAVQLSEKKHEIDRRRFSYLIEVISNIEVIKSFNLEGFMERRYERLMQNTAEVGAEATQRANFAQAVTGAIGQYTPAIVASAGSILVIQQSITVGALAAVTLLGSRIVQPLLRLAALKSSDDDVRRAEKDLEDFINAADFEHGNQPCEQLDNLSLRNIELAHKAENKSLFKNLNLEIKRGEIIAIDGANGAGRSSLLWLIMGYFKTTQGEILVNNQPKENFDPSDLRSRIAYLASEPKMLAGTVLENMTNFQPELYAHDAFDVADALGLTDYFAKHQEGLNTKVGQGMSAGLPTSVAQRVPLVGALVGHPDLILFDSANTNLDLEGDQKLLDYLASLKGRSAIIMVTDRPSYKRIADRHLLLENGNLSEVEYQPFTPQKPQEARA